jgi:phage baseplate assembly protein W
MEYLVTSDLGTLDRIDFGATGVKEVLQNVKTLLCTKKFSVPLDRDIGLAFSPLDMPYPKAQAGIRAEIFQAIREFEPRAKAVKVDFDVDPIDGKLVSKAVVEVNV